LLLKRRTLGCWSYLLIYSEGKERRGWRFYCLSVEIQQLVIFQLSTPERSHPPQLQSKIPTEQAAAVNYLSACQCQIRDAVTQKEEEPDVINAESFEEGILDYFS